MKFEIDILEESHENKPQRSMTVEASNWFSALHSALKSMNDLMTMQNINFTVLEDGKSAEVEDPNSTRVFLIKAKEEEMKLGRTPPQRDTFVELRPPVVEEFPKDQEPRKELRSLDNTGPTTAYEPDELAQILQRAKLAAPPSDAEMPYSRSDSLSTEKPEKPRRPEPRPTVKQEVWKGELQTGDEISSGKVEGKEPDSDRIRLEKAGQESTTPKKSRWVKHHTMESATSVAPLVRPKSFSVQGFYMPGTTGQFLTDAFMKLASLYEHFGADKKAAIRYVLNMLSKSIQAEGGGVLLTDINDPLRIGWFEVAFGSAESDLLNARLPLSQGVFGFCLENGGSISVPDLEQEERFKDDFLLTLQSGVGPAMFAPIEHDGAFLGVHVRYRASGEKAFTSGELSIFEYMSQSLGEYLASIDGA